VDPYTTGSVEGPYILEGTVIEQEEDAISFQLHPGVVVDLKRDQTEAVEQATDPATGRTLVRVTLKPDAELSAVFQLRLARLAASQAGGMPFPLGVATGPDFVGPGAVSFGRGSAEARSLYPGRSYCYTGGVRYVCDYYSPSF
jgi:hypothetical protein